MNVFASYINKLKNEDIRCFEKREEGKSDHFGPEI